MRVFLILLLFFLFQPFAFSMENVFYILHDNKEQAMAEIVKHVDLTHILIAQSYHINKEGVVSGEIDADILDFTKKHSIKLLAMVTNTQFDAQATHHFLADLKAQKKALDTILEECKKNNFYGVQFDFEMILLADKTALTTFYQTAADLFHKNGLIVSFAIAPTLMDNHFPTMYQQKLYEVWQGAYDFQKLGEMSDFVTIMSYDQHARGTTPGPIASIPWDEQVIQHALKFIPANKISLGIPTYSGFWYMSMGSRSSRVTIHYDAINYQTVKYILNKSNTGIHWDELNKVNYAFFESSGINKYLFIEDGQSFQAKKELAKKYQLRGISVFRLGIEDPAIWEKLADKPWWVFWN